MIDIIEALHTNSPWGKRLNACRDKATFIFMMTGGALWVTQGSPVNTRQAKGTNANTKSFEGKQDCYGIQCTDFCNRMIEIREIEQW